MTRVPKPDVFENFDTDADALIEASAGAGKTYTLEHLVVEHVLNEDDTSVDEILVVTFTRRAAGELKARVRSRLEALLRASETGGDGCNAENAWQLDEEDARSLEKALNDLERATMTTLHGFCEEVLQTWGVELGTELAPRHIDEDELIEEAFWSVLRSELACGRHRRWLEAWLEDRSLSDLYEDLAEIYRRNAVVVPGRSEMTLDAPVDGGQALDPSSIEEDWRFLTEIRRRFARCLRREVDRRKQVEGVLTYDDMIERVYRAVKRNNAIVAQLRDTYTHALVDEFQDTSPKQWAIFQKLFFESEDHTLAVIGDPKQSIYGFRGADLATYRDAVDKFTPEEDSGNTAPLEVNYRSTQALMNAVNPLFDEDDGLLGDQQTSYDSIDAANAEKEGAWPTKPVHLFKLRSDDEGPPGNMASTTALVTKTVDEIERLLCDVEPTIPGEDGEERQLKPGDIYVLTRANYEADDVGEELRDRGIPRAFYNKDGLFQTHEAEHVRRLLEAAANPEDRSACRKAMLTPFFDIDLADLDDYDGREPDRRTARSLLTEWNRAARHRDIDTLFERILQESRVVQRESLREGGHRRLTNYRQLFDWLTRKAATLKVGLGPLADHLGDHIEERETVEDDGDTQRIATDRSAVQLMTMHSAKGLDAEVVFLTGGYSGWHASAQELQVYRPGKDTAEVTHSAGSAEQGDQQRVPVAYQGGSPDAHPDLQSLWSDHRHFERRETARLFYVAVTRAKRRVYLPWVQGGHPDVQLDPLFRAIDHVAENEQQTFDRLYVEEPVKVDDPAEQRTREPPSDFELPARAREVLSKRAPDEINGQSFNTLRDRTRSVESYSSLTGGSTTDKTFVPDDRADDEGTLPPSRRSGDALHEVLEEMDYTEVVETASFEEWWTDTAVDELVRDRLEEHDLTPEDYAEHAGRILYDALRAEIEPRDGESFEPISPLGALARDRTRREVSFHMPTPEEVHPSVDRLEDRTGPLVVERGYLRGYIDLVFEHDDRLYVADWKGNSRMEEGDYSPSAIETNVRENYDLQAGLYTLAVCRLAGITDREAYDQMGGLFYFYLRGLRPDHPGHGYYFRRPDWSEICNLEERVRRSGRDAGDHDQLKQALQLQTA